MRPAPEIALVLAALVALPSPARAQGPEKALLLTRADEGAPGDRIAAFRAHTEQAQRSAGLEPLTDPVAHALEAAEREGTLPRERVRAFDEVQSRLGEARRLQAELNEQEALSKLAGARQIAVAHADIPGAAAWIAEVEIATAITAAQVGLDELSRSSIARAATLDGTRAIRAGEAPPDVVARAAAIVAAVATRPLGSFEVRCDAPGARVFLDDREVGPTPRLVRAPVGAHVLRVDAPGHVPWGSVVDVLEGRRPPVDVALSADPRLAAARRLVSASAVGDYATAPASVAALGVAAAWFLEVGGGEQERALLVRCTADRCDVPRGLELERVPFVLPRPRDARVELALALGERRDWIGEPAPIPPPLPPPKFWQRWWFWTLVGVAVAGGAVAIVGGILTIPPEQDFQVVINPSEL